jgi:hypothetical protein
MEQAQIHPDERRRRDYGKYSRVHRGFGSFHFPA